MGAIDVGSNVAGLDNLLTSNTYIDTINPANDTGTLTSFTLTCWPGFELTGIKLFTAYNVSGQDWTPRTVQSVADMAGGDTEKTYAVNLQVHSGDSIGCYFVGGRVKIRVAGGSGKITYVGDGTGGQQTYYYGDIAAQGMGFYAIGSTGGVVVGQPPNRAKRMAALGLI